MWLPPQHPELRRPAQGLMRSAHQPPRQPVLPLHHARQVDRRHLPVAHHLPPLDDTGRAPGSARTGSAPRPDPRPPPPRCPRHPRSPDPPACPASSDPQSARPSTRAPPSVAISSASRALIASAPRLTRCNSIACRASAIRLPASLRGRSVDPQAPPSPPHPASPAPARCPTQAGNSNRGNAQPRCRERAKRSISARIQLHAMRVPDIVAGPAQILGILPRTAAELAPANRRYPRHSRPDGCAASRPCRAPAAPPRASDRG